MPDREVAERITVRRAFRVADQAVVAAGWPLLIVDVSGLDSVEAAVLGAVVAVHRHLRVQGGAVVCGRSGPFEKVARISGMTHMLTRAATLHEARYRVIVISAFTEEQVRQRYPSA